MSRSQIFLFSSAGFLLGVLTASFASLSIILLGFIFLITITVLWFGISQNNTRLYGASILLSTFLFGVLWFAHDLQSIAESARLVVKKSPITLSGFIADEPERREASQHIIVQGKTIVMNGEESQFPYRALLIVRPYPEYTYGNQVSVTGVLERPESFNDFDYASYLAKDDIYFLMRYPDIAAGGDEKSLRILFQKKLFSVKNFFIGSIQRSLSEPHASYIAGLLVGARTNIPQDIKNAFQKTGTIHVLALSGFNISIIADNLLRFLVMLSIPFSISFWIAVFAIIFFTFSVGAQASIVRAAIMGILVLVARRHSRLYDAKMALLAAGAFMVFVDPKILRFDIGFQLSFLATAGIIFLTPYFESLFQKISALWLRETLATTCAAQGAVLPAILWYFGGISLLSPLANVAILPLIPTTMLFGFLTGIGGFILPIIGKIIGIGAWLFSYYELSIIALLARVPFVYIELSHIFLFFFFILYAFFLKSAIRAYYLKEKSQEATCPAVASGK